MNKKTGIAFLFVLFSLAVSAQWQDFGVWTEITAEKKINPRWEVSWTESVRLNENALQFQQHYSHLAAGYKISKNFQLALAYRNSQKVQPDESVDYRNRAQLEAVYKLKWKKIGIEFQERYQVLYKNIGRESGWKDPEITYRSRITVDYDLDRKIKPFASFEVFITEEIYANNLRSRIGFDYDFNKKHSARLFYMIDQDVQENDPLRLYALGLAYKFSF